MLRWLALIYLLMSVIGIFLLAPINKKSQNEPQNHECPDLKTGLKSRQHVMLFISAFCSSACGLYMAGAYKAFGNTKIDNDDFLAVVGSISSIFNGCFRFVWASIMDKTSFRSTYTILLCIQIFLLSTLYYIASIDALFLLWISMIMMCEGGHFSLFPTVFANLFGRK